MKLQEIIQALHNNDPKLIELELQSDENSKEDFKFLANALENNTTLTKLNLAFNSIDYDGAKFFADALQKNKTLKTLNLSRNNIREAGAKSITDALENNTTLTELNLAFNSIGDGGAKFFADVLQKNKTLKTLDLSSNKIKDAGLKFFKAALEKNTTLIELGLSDAVYELDNSSSPAMLSIKQSLSRNRILYVQNIMEKIKYSTDPERLPFVLQELNNAVNFIEHYRSDIQLQACKNEINDAIAFTEINLELHKIGIYGLRQFRVIKENFSKQFPGQDIKNYKPTIDDDDSSFNIYRRQLGKVKQSNYLDVAQNAARQLGAISEDNPMYKYAQEALDNLVQDLSAIYFSEHESEEKRKCDDVIKNIRGNPSESTTSSPIIPKFENECLGSSSNTAASNPPSTPTSKLKL